MKRVFSALVGLTAVAALNLTSATQAQNKSTREATYALQGPASSMQVEEAKIVKQDGKYVEGPRVLRMKVLFNEDGSRPDLFLYDEKGSLVRRIEMRFEGGKNTEFLNYDGRGRMWLRGVYSYDRDGRLSGRAHYNGDGSLLSRTTHKRNAKGEVIETTEHNGQGALLDKLVYTLDASGRLQSRERTSYHPNGAVSLRDTYTASAKRVESVYYNQDGSIARRSVRIDRQINEFGPDGSLTKTIDITYPDRLPMESVHNPDGSVTRDSQIVDEVDSHGNWLKQTRWISDSQGTRPIKVTYREITYFGGAPLSPRPIN